ncbi:MAG: hypothetical protein M1820_000133 [Bogoriella megaspora]|nr:MAG: hypothetical protein M1820_000133 [Bogoriella megaspora]
MASTRFRIDKPANKKKREALNLKHKKAKAAQKRELQFRRKKEESEDPGVQRKRRERNVPTTIDRKRVWDEVGAEDDDNALGLAVDAARLKRRRTSEEPEGWPDGEDTDFEGLSSVEKEDDSADDDDDDAANTEDEVDSMLDSGSDEEGEQSREGLKSNEDASDMPGRTSSPTGSSTTADMNLTPEFLISKFPSLFEPPKEPKILITTSLQSTLHSQAQQLTSLFANANYIRRNKHRHSHNYSIREIAQFASNRAYTSLIILNEWRKTPSGLDIVHLPSGPMFHFSLSNWVEGKKLPGHGNPTSHHPELILNRFITPLGLLTAHLFRTLFPPQPELIGRQVITMHNQRDYIFVRRHRYIFRDRRETEKKIVGTDGREMKGVEGIRAGLQELGPRFTLKLRRVDKGVQRASGQEWEWKAGSEKQRTRFQL